MSEIVKPERRRRGRNIILFGEFGVGKSTLAATAPAPAVLDSDKGSAAYETRPGFAHVRVIDINTSEQLERAYANFQGITKNRWDTKFKTLVHDRFEDIQQMALEEMNAKIVEANPGRDIDGYDKKEWGRMGTRMRRYVRQMKTLPVHKIYVCGRQNSDEVGGWVPALAGGMRGIMPGLVDDVMYLRVGKNGQRFLHLHPTEEFYAKTRAWWLTPDDAKIRVPDPSKDPKFMTTLITRLIAGPTRATPRRTENE